MNRFFHRWLGIATAAVLAGSLPAETFGSRTTVTNLQELHSLVAGQQRITTQLRLNAVVCWVSPSSDQAVIQDDSGAARIELDPLGTPVRPGDIIALEGSGTTVEDMAGITIGKTLVVNRGRDSAAPEASGKVFLTKGRHPIHVTWFDPDGTNSFNVSYQLPDGDRQTIPPTALSHQVTNAPAGSSFAPGVSWRNYRGEWQQRPDSLFITTKTNPPITDDFEWWQTPDYAQITPLNAGLTPDFNLTAPVHGQFHGYYFSYFDGWLDAPQTGAYTFYTTPAGASQVSVGLPQVLVLSQTNLPVARQLMLGQILSPTQECLWASVEGKVVSIQDEPSGYSLDLSSDTGHLRVALNKKALFATWNWVGGRMRMTGIISSVCTREQHWIPGVLWVPDQAHVERLSPSNTVGQPETWPGMNTNRAGLPLLTSIESIKLLKPNEANQGYPVKIQGIVTWAKPKAVILQDLNSAIFVNVGDLDDDFHLRLGERWEVEGQTMNAFAPNLQAQRVRRLGRGLFPEPVHPFWNQLYNGSQDALYVEIQGVVTDVKHHSVNLLLPEGKLLVLLPETPSEKILNTKGALIRIRGCLFAVKDPVTRVFKIGEVEIRAATFIVDEPAATDLFSAPAKRVADLLLYDVQAARLKPIRISGQIVGQRADFYYLMDDLSGLRFFLQKPDKLEVGNQVEVVGYPRFSGISPELREGVARKIGSKPLPVPRVLPEDGLLGEAWNFTLIQADGLLTSMGKNQGEQIFGLQAGTRVFQARLPASTSKGLSFLIGSRLRVKGVLVCLSGDRSLNGTINSFEILLNGPEDVLLLARPAWSNLRQLFIVAAVLGGCTLILLLWNWSLQLQVARRGAQLRVEITERENLEKLRAIEEERSRIARDLHDDLGSSLTEISFLADAGTGSPPSVERAATRFQTIANKARALVNALDVIVWLINPKKDNLTFLAGYLGRYAKEYLAVSDIVCRPNIRADFPDLKLNSQMRHNLFLAVKEALHNIVKHAHASEVRINFLCHDGTLEINIADNGRGFDLSAPVEGNGLTNIKARLANAGGDCEFISQPGAGTTVHLKLPLPTSPSLE